MKKFFLLIGLSILSFASFAEKVPAVIVNKSQGGFTAVLNMYNYVSYTPPEATSNGIGRLDCSGNGFSPCRVPNSGISTVNVGNSTITVSDPAKLNAFKTAINDVIAMYENAVVNNTNQNTVTNSHKIVPNSYTKTIAINNASKGGKKAKTETFVVRGVVSSHNGNNSTMKIYIEQTNLLSIGGGN